jgi:thiol:disulfide interchange protein DsbD
VTVLVGDWTRPDPRIATYLEQRGRAGIPLYIFVGADGREVELPQLLTVSQLTALVGEKA